MIYEGANGVQAMDLVGRKLAMNGGRAIQLFLKIVEEEVAQAKQNEKLTKFAEALEKDHGQLQPATMWPMQHGMTTPTNPCHTRYSYLPNMGLGIVGPSRVEQRWTAQDGR